MNINLDALRRLDRTKKVIILAVLCGALVGLYVWLLYLPKQEEIGRIEKRLTGLLNKKAEQQAIVQNLEAFKTEARNLEMDLERALAQLPRQKEIPTLLQNISNLGRESGLDMPYFKPGGTINKDFYAEVPVDIKLLGPYQNLLNFFYQLGDLPRIVTVQDLTIQHAARGAPADHLDVACKAVTYRFLEEHERTPKESAAKRGR